MAVRLLYLLIVCLPVRPLPADTTTAPLLAGTGQAEIMPPVGTPLAGYSKRHGEPSTGVEAPLYARALALRQGTATAVLVSAELLIITEPLAHAAARAVQADAGRQPVTLVLSATHTHSGPGAYGRHVLERVSMGAYDPRVFERLVAGIRDAVAQALDHMSPVDVGYGEAAIPELIRNRRDPAGLVDSTLQVFALRDRAGAVRAVLVNVAAHPTALGADNFVMSGDYPGVVMRALEAQYPGSVCLLTVGNLGDQGPVIAEKNVPSMVAYGHRVAAAALRVMTQLAWNTAPALEVAQAPVPLPRGRLRLGAVTLPHVLSRLVLGHHTAQLTVVRLDDLLLVGYPGEPTARVGEQLKQRVARAGFHGYLMALTNPYAGYMLLPEEYATGGYEAQMCVFGPDAAECLATAAMRLVEQMSHAAP